MTTLADHLAVYLADLVQHARSNTVRAYRADLTLAAAHLPGALTDLSLAQVEAFLAVDACSPATHVRRVAALRSFFTWALRHELCAQNPLDHYKVRSITRRLPRPIRQHNDLEAVDAAIGAAPQPYRLIFTLLRETGMRVGEVLALSLKDVDLDPGREGLRVREAKNAHERLVILGADATKKSLRGLRSLLRTLRGQPGYVPLFRSNRGTRVSYAAVQYQWAELCRNAGLTEPAGSLRYTLHQLRHTRGTELVQQGQRLEIVQRVLGHRDIRSTQGYAELDDLQVRAALEQAGWS
ncbi:MAG: tyrosine-type recombinase/integrase [Herpetosiphon sp.]